MGHSICGKCCRCPLYYGSNCAGTGPYRQPDLSDAGPSVPLTLADDQRPARPLLIERFKLSRLLLLSQSGQFVFFAVMAAYLGIQGGNASLFIVFLLIFAMSFLDGWTVPARNALVPRLTASREGLLRANGLLSVSDQVVQFAGWGLSGLIIIWIGTSSTLLLTAVIYALAALFTLQIREPEAGNTALEPSATGSESNLPRNSGWSVLSEGWKIIWRTPALRALTAIDAIDMLGGSVWVGAFTLILSNRLWDRVKNGGDSLTLLILPAPSAEDCWSFRLYAGSAADCCALC